ncbi:RHS repeat protein [Emticicia sp. C21]|uniref:RHS repeat protein n=1 Tax=Emticicia sp. C21 TaxID=2302915 RepID=UPI000E342051|nr:RHS repeat protein [Emticicia sp. C21]RFS16820.1 hypothetical protein D0T08_09060 [Emticicia sp. C21]
MNKIITTLVLAGLVFACKPKSEDIRPQEETACRKLSYKDIIGSTVMISENYVYDITGKLIEFNRLGKTIRYTYDTQGNLLKTTEYTQNLNGEVKLSEIENTYNATNQLVKQITHVYNYQSMFDKETEVLYEYHANGKMKKKTTTNLTLPVPDSIVDYNEKGKEILIQYRSGQYLKTEYNGADLIVKQTGYYPSNNQTTEVIHEYNTQNLEVKYTISINGVRDSYMTYEYNAKGKLIMQIQYNGDSTIGRKYIIEYTGENYKISTYNGPSQLLGYEINEIQNGLLMKWSAYQNNKLVYYMTYAYDSHKNLIELTTFNNNSAMTERQEWIYQCD